MTRFSPEHLRALRRDVPLASVIEDLRIPVFRRHSRGVFRCPVCRTPHAALHPRLNLARCFRCERNFNPIDLVIAERGWSFPVAVRYLDNMLARPVGSPPSPVSCGTQPFFNSRQKPGSS